MILITEGKIELNVQNQTNKSLKEEGTEKGRDRGWLHLVGDSVV